MHEREVGWDDLNRTRKNILSKSDWTQLMDSGLTLGCIIEWQAFRAEIRKINSGNYAGPLLGIRALSSLQSKTPTNVYAKEYDGPKNYRTTYDKVELKNYVIDIMREMQPEPTVGPTLDTIDDIPTARKHAQNELESYYRDKIRHVSPPAELTQLYLERLNEAIDLLSNTATVFPLLGILSESLNKSMVDVAASILRSQSNMIHSMAEIEQEYIDSLKLIKKADTIGGLKSALENFHGYRH
jgi:hypothetical protein